MINWIKTTIVNTGRFIKAKIKWFLIATGVIGIAFAVSAPIDEVSFDKVHQKYEQATELKAKYQMDGISLVRKNIKNPELDKYKGEPKDEIKITLGNKDLDEFIPEIELKRWNEVSFKIKPKGLDKIAKKDKKLKFEGDKIKYDTPDMSYEMYEYTEGEGGYKYIWYLNKKPKTNIIEFDFETNGLDFFYQPPLNEEYPQSENCSPTECDTDGDGELDSFRPENIVGSYVVYHSTKGGMNDIYGKDYKTGQAGIIYKPHLTDVEGSEAWGDLFIDVENGIYRITIPTDFYENAVYPIMSNDTFGYEIDAASNYGNDDILYTYGYSSGGAGTITKISAYCLVPSSFFHLIVYDGSNRIDYSDTFDNNNTLQWEHRTPQIGADITAQTYYLGIFSNYNPNYIRYNTVSGQTNHYDEENYSYPPPATWTKTVSSQTRKFAIYATYTPGGAAERRLLLPAH